MHLLKCFVCDNKSIIYCENVFARRSSHTDTPVMDILNKFAEDLEMTAFRPSKKSTKTIICQMCMIKVNEYDLACMTARDMENQLKDLLRKKGVIDDITSDEDYRPEAEPEEYSDDDDDGGGDYSVDVKVRNKSDFMSNVGEVSLMRCNVCEINFKSYSELTSHTHKPKKIQGLTIKKINNKGRSRTLKHFNDNKHSRSVDTVSKVKKIKTRNFSCRHCELKFYNKKELREHRKECHTSSENPNRCTICRGLYPDNDAFEKHMAMHEGKDRLQCVECNAMFVRRCGLIRHMPFHTGEVLHVCDLCGMEFIYESSFRRHMLYHGNIRNHSCSVCKKMFVTSTHLKVHMRSHSSEKPYKCPLCETHFTYRYSMLAHYKTHPGVGEHDLVAKKSSHKCSLCSLTFPQRRKLDDHYVSVHDAIIDGTSKRNSLPVAQSFSLFGQPHQQLKTK